MRETAKVPVRVRRAMSLALNRDPTWMAILRAWVDAMHFQGHTSCAESFNSGAFYDSVVACDVLYVGEVSRMPCPPWQCLRPAHERFMHQDSLCAGAYPQEVAATLLASAEAARAPGQHEHAQAAVQPADAAAPAAGAPAHEIDDNAVLVDAVLRNPSFAEQHNRWLANFKAGAIHMRQCTLLYILRVAFYKHALGSAPDSASAQGRDVAKRRRMQQKPTAALTRAVAPRDVAATLAAARAALADVRQLAEGAHAAAA